MTRYEKIAQAVWAGRTDIIAGLHELPEEELEDVQQALEKIRGAKLNLRAPPRRLHRAIAVARAR